MSIFSRETFNKAIPVYVRRNFKGAGRNWITGQLFDWKHGGLDVRRIRLLFEGGYLTHLNPDQNEVTKKEIKQTVSEPQAANGEEALCYTLVRTAGQWHNVVAPDGRIINEKGMKRDDALALIEELTAGNEETLGDTE